MVFLRILVTDRLGPELVLQRYRYRHPLQNLAPGNFDGLAAPLTSQSTYENVRTAQFPAAKSAVKSFNVLKMAVLRCWPIEPPDRKLNLPSLKIRRQS